MNLLDIYCSWQRKDITDEEVAEAYGLSAKDWKFRTTKWGHRLPLLLSMLDKIKEGQVTRSDAAVALEVSVRQVNNLMRTWSVNRPIAEYAFNKVRSEVKWEVRKKFAIEYIADSCTVEEAATNAGVSTRQMRRWVSDLLRKHFQMVFKDLKQVTHKNRVRLANEVETAEGLESAKSNAIRSIVVGEKRIEDEAIDRLLKERKRRRNANVRLVGKTKPGSGQ